MKLDRARDIQRANLSRKASRGIHPKGWRPKGLNRLKPIAPATDSTPYAYMKDRKQRNDNRRDGRTWRQRIS